MAQPLKNRVDEWVLNISHPPRDHILNCVFEFLHPLSRCHLGPREWCVQLVVTKNYPEHVYEIIELGH